MAGQLRNEGYNVKIVDLNIDFYLEHLTKEYIQQSIKNLYNIINGEYGTNKNFSEKKYNQIKTFLNNTNNIEKISELISRAIEIFKKPELFYNPQLLISAKNIINKSVEIIFLQYDIDIINEPVLGYECLKKIIFNPEQNIFIDFYKKKIKQLNMQDYDYIGISCSGYTQILSTLTLANLLKTETNAHINIGGNIFSDFSADLPKHPDFFDIFADSVSYGQGEKTIISMAKYIKGEVNINEIPNLFYKRNGQVVKNKDNSDPPFSEIQMPDFSDYDLSRYIFPHIVLPLQTSKGCYHNKCTFCNFCYSTKYKIKNIQSLINEIRRNIEKYNIKHFFIIDDSIHPLFLDKFSDEILKNRLDIRFDIFARMEKEFTYDILKNAYNAGLRRIRWGLESSNKRVNALMNKGIDTDNAEHILKNASDAGIYNTVNIIYGFPTATYEEDMETLNFIKKNYKNKIIHYINISQFSVRRGSYISLNPEEYKLEIEQEQNDFSPFLKFRYKYGNEAVNKMKIEYENFEKEKEIQYYKLYLTSPQSFLYVCQYGKDKLNTLMVPNAKIH